MGWRTSTTARASLELVDNVKLDKPPSGFAEICEHHRPMLRRYALRLSGNADAAADLVQETLFRALRTSFQLQPGTNAAAWLTRILGNLFRDQFNHSKVEAKAIPELAHLNEAAAGTPIETLADTDLHTAIQALEPELREVIELCSLKQMKYHEAAAILNVPSGTVATRLARAKRRLREYLTTRASEAVKP